MWRFFINDALKKDELVNFLLRKRDFDNVVMTNVVPSSVLANAQTGLETASTLVVTASGLTSAKLIETIGEVAPMVAPIFVLIKIAIQTYMKNSSRLRQNFSASWSIGTRGKTF
jgi:hypothetical protein